MALQAGQPHVLLSVVCFLRPSHLRKPGSSSEDGAPLKLCFLKPVGPCVSEDPPKRRITFWSAGPV